jgi:hypothetical protein
MKVRSVLIDLKHGVAMLYDHDLLSFSKVGNIS